MMGFKAPPELSNRVYSKISKNKGYIEISLTLMPYRVSRNDFDSLVEKAVEGLPEEFKKYFTNITIMVEDYPSKEDKRLTSSKGLLLGLFKGVPYTKKGGFFTIPYPMPDKIVLFQKNIESLCSSEKELIEQITRTLIHEVGHYFGFSENDLRKHGF